MGDDWKCVTCGAGLPVGYAGATYIAGMLNGPLCRVCSDKRMEGLRGLAAREVHDPPPPPKGDRVLEREATAERLKQDDKVRTQTLRRKARK